MAVAITLDFTLIKCARCGSDERVAGRPCSGCGNEGRRGEVNALVVRRRQGIRVVRAHLAAIETAEAEVLPFYLTRSSWRATTSNALVESIAALAKFSRSPLEYGSQLAAGNAVARLREIDRALSTFVPRRPFVSSLAANQKASMCLVRMADFYLDALSADLPTEAQALGIRAQDQIDAATKFMNDAESEQEMGDQLGSADPQGFVSAAFTALARLHPGKTFMEVDGIRQSLLSQSLGREVAVGQGAAFEIALVLARSVLDVQRFESVVAEASRLCASSTSLLDIAGESGALESLRRARNAIVESTAAFAVTLEASTTDEARLRRTIGLYRELFEYAGLPLFAWFLRVGGAKSAPLSTLMQKDSTALLDAIARRPDLASIFVGADKNIRTAASHGLSYELVGDDVVFNTRSFKGTMTLEVVIDLLLALIESFLAAFWVLDNELTVAGVEGHTSADSLVGAPMLVIAEEVLKHLGATVLSARMTEAGWLFGIAAGAPSAPLVYAGSLAANPPLGINEVSIVCPHLPEGNLRLTRAASERFGLAKDASPMTLVGANLDMISESSLNGRSAVTADHLRRSACTAGLALLSEDDIEAIRLLRKCISLAHKAGAPDVVTFAESAIVQWRAPEQRRLKELRETMTAWNTLPTPQEPLVRTTTITALHDVH